MDRSRRPGVRLHRRWWDEAICLRKVQRPIRDERTDWHLTRPRGLHWRRGACRSRRHRLAHGNQHRSVARPVGRSRTLNHHAAGNWLPPAPPRVAGRARHPFLARSVCRVRAFFSLEVSKEAALRNQSMRFQHSCFEEGNYCRDVACNVSVFLGDQPGRSLIIALQVFLSKLSHTDVHGANPSTASARNPSASNTLPLTTIPGTPIRSRTAAGSLMPLRSLRTR